MRLLLILLVALTSLGVALEMRAQRKAGAARSAGDAPVLRARATDGTPAAPAAGRPATKRSKNSTQPAPAAPRKAKTKPAASNLKIKHASAKPSASSFDGARL